MQLTVLQWNVWYKQNIQHVLEVLRAHPADVICLQELTHGYIGQNSINTWEYLARELGLDYKAQEIPILTETAQWLQANAIFSKYPITGSRAVWLHTPHDDADIHDQYRGYLEITVDDGGTAATIATTHLSFTERPDHDHELQHLLAQAKPERYVLTGDLNATPDSPRVKALASTLQHAGPPFSQNTWTTKPFHLGDFTATTLDWRYDYIFTSRDITVHDARVISTDVSDHLPVIAKLTLPR
jgi:endonuclease/exonuclease/phosphatase family metal-dependent hydrolase